MSASLVEPGPTPAGPEPESPAESAAESVSGMERKPRRRFGVLVRTVAIVAVLLLVAELLVRSISEYLPNPEAATLGEVVLKRARIDQLASSPLDVVFIGDSTMDAAGDVQAFLAASKNFHSAYNASLRGALLENQENWFNSVVLPSTRPRLVLNVINPASMLTPPKVISDAGSVELLVDEEIAQSDDSIWRSIDRKTSDLSYVVRYRSSLRIPQRVYGAANSRLTEGKTFEDTQWGVDIKQADFWPRSVSSDGQFIGYRGADLPATFNAELLKHYSGLQIETRPMDNLLQNYASKGVATVVVIPPAPLATWKANGVDVDQWRQVAGRIVDQASGHGVVALDFTDGDYPREFFHDYLHLTRAGAAKFSAELAQRVDVLCSNHTLNCE